MLKLRNLILLPFLTVAACGHSQVKFSVQYPSSAFAGPFSGRVVVYLNHGGGEPRIGPDWLNPQPMYSAFFKDVAPGTAMVISDANDIGFPGKISALPEGDYHVEAVVDRDLGGRSIGESPGNLYSADQTVHISGTETISLNCDQVIQEKPFVETAHVKEFKIQSKLLTEFYGRPTFIKGAVELPNAYLNDPSKKFPVLYEVPGFGGGDFELNGSDSAKQTLRDGVPFVYVMLDPNVPTGHCVFADSANNGPWGAALTTEYIPALETKFHCINKPDARFVTGHSSGGWSSLWLQVAYPTVFGGVWSTSPDPVDFHLFQLVDIYKPGANMFHDDQGNPVALAREGDKPVIFTKPFSDMERPIRGEQLGSFEAVFSPKGPDGQPEKLWDRETGAINPEVAEAWKKYDIALKLHDNWKTLVPLLKGKLHVFCGDMDTFYLDGALHLLKKEMADLGSDAEIEFVPGDHFSMMSPALRKKIDSEMAAKFQASAH